MDNYLSFVKVNQKQGLLTETLKDSRGDLEAQLLHHALENKKGGANDFVLLPTLFS